jgi:hypothetical protein
MTAVDGDRVHFCAGCKKNVYNLSAMTQAEAEGLLRKHEGHLCVRYYQRSDGTVLTQNCPVGRAALRMKMIARSKQAALAAVAMATIVALGEYRMASQQNVVMGAPMAVTPSPKPPVGHDVSSREVMGTPAIVPELRHQEFLGQVAVSVSEPYPYHSTSQQSRVIHSNVKGTEGGDNLDKP